MMVQHRVRPRLPAVPSTASRDVQGGKAEHTSRAGARAVSRRRRPAAWRQHRGRAGQGIPIEDPRDPGRCSGEDGGSADSAWGGKER